MTRSRAHRRAWRHRRTQHVLLWRSGRYFKARDHLMEALRIQRERRNRATQSLPLINLGLSYEALHGYDEALPT